MDPLDGVVISNSIGAKGYIIEALEQSNDPQLSSTTSAACVCMRVLI